MSHPKQKKQRLDAAMTERGLEASRARAQARILAGDVLVNGLRVDKAGSLVALDAEITLKQNSVPYVSRGGLKLKAAIDLWPAPIEGAIALDVGASTGGFTQVLLSCGAERVYAVDVGYGQLAYSLRIDPRVVVMERTHILKLEPNKLHPRPTVASVDVSFIGLKRILGAVVRLLENTAYLYVLVKPQFELGREKVGKGGIVRDEADRQLALNSVIEEAQRLGLTLLGHAHSPITGADGNVEFIAAFKKTN